MSIDLKAHGLRVKPLEWQMPYHKMYRAKNYRIYAIDDDCTLWRASYRGDSFDNWLSPAPVPFAAASEAAEKHHESQVLALLEQVEGGQ